MGSVQRALYMDIESLTAGLGGQGTILKGIYEIAGP